MSVYCVFPPFINVSKWSKPTPLLLQVHSKNGTNSNAKSSVKESSFPIFVTLLLLYVSKVLIYKKIVLTNNFFLLFQIVRLVKDMKTNSTELLCALNISEYIPDKTGLLTKLKTSLCQFNKTALFMEITPFRLAGMVSHYSLQ